MFALVELKTAALDIGIPGMSPLGAALAFLLMFGLPMIPYAIFYRSLREKRSTTPEAADHRPFEKFMGWMHMHHHPQLLHH